MPCDTIRRRPKQTLNERKKDIRRAVEAIGKGIIAGRVKVKVGPQGAIVFDGVSDEDRDGVTDACAYRQLMVSGSSLALAKIEQAEQVAGRPVNKQVVGQGVHSHDGGHTWHGKG